jgi:hypothetical protein
MVNKACNYLQLSKEKGILKVVDIWIQELANVQVFSNSCFWLLGSGRGFGNPSCLQQINYT